MIWKALGNPKKIKIIQILNQLEGVTQETLQTMLNLSPSTISEYLVELRDLGLISEDRKPPHNTKYYNMGKKEKAKFDEEYLKLFGNPDEPFDDYKEMNQNR